MRFTARDLLVHQLVHHDRRCLSHRYISHRAPLHRACPPACPPCLSTEPVHQVEYTRDNTFISALNYRTKHDKTKHCAHTQLYACLRLIVCARACSRVCFQFYVHSRGENGKGKYKCANSSSHNVHTCKMHTLFCVMCY